MTDEQDEEDLRLALTAAVDIYNQTLATRDHPYDLTCIAIMGGAIYGVNIVSDDGILNLKENMLQSIQKGMKVFTAVLHSNVYDYTPVAVTLIGLALFLSEHG